MKQFNRFAIVLILLLAFTLPGTALAGGLITDRVVFGSNFTLQSGETLDGNLIVFGGNVTLEPDSMVTGDVVFLGGNAQFSGTVEGSVISLGGLVRLESHAVVEGDVASLGGSLIQADGARILGDVTTGENGPLSLTFPGGVQLPNLDVGFGPVLNLVGFTFKVFLWAALAVLAVLFAPKHLERIASTAVSQPLVSGGLGLLSVVVLPPALLILTITILLSPVALVAAAVAALAWILGLLALGSELGRRLEAALHQEWAPAVSAGIGTFVLLLVINTARVMIPCVGWIFPAAAGMLGLGAVLLTRFGTQPYPPPGAPPVQSWGADPLAVVPAVAPVQSWGADPLDAILAEAPVQPVSPAALEKPVEPESPVAPEPPAGDA